jgi:glycosyltransferase involved in cell wall biosynthesis
LDPEQHTRQDCDPQLSRSPLSIAIFGNTNNYPLLLAQGLKALGHSVRLIINRKDILHRPEARYPAWASSYPDWVFDCSDITDEDIAYKTPAIEGAIRHLTHNVDLAILNDSGPALANYLRAPHVVVLTGSDLAYYANFESIQMRTDMWSPEFKRSPQGRRYVLNFADFVARQRDGILAAEVVCYGQRGLVPSGDRLLDEIGVQDQRRLMLHFSNTVDLHPQKPPKNRRLSILCGCRIVYRPEKNPTLSEMDFKGTDVLIKGFAEYVKRGGQGRLRLPRKGQDLTAAISLIADLGIGGSIRWLDETPLAGFYQEMRAADLVCDQFGSSFPGMVTTDAFALGRPVIANLRNEIFGKRFGEPLPGFDARTPEQICEHLALVEGNRDLLADMGRRSRVYAERFLSPQSMAEQLLEEISSHQP